jgi:hypothetical protein
MVLLGDLLVLSSKLLRAKTNYRLSAAGSPIKGKYLDIQKWADCLWLATSRCTIMPFTIVPYFFYLSYLFKTRSFYTYKRTLLTGPFPFVVWGWKLDFGVDYEISLDYTVFSSSIGSHTPCLFLNTASGCCCRQGQLLCCFMKAL